LGKSNQIWEKSKSCIPQNIRSPTAMEAVSDSKSNSLVERELDALIVRTCRSQSRKLGVLGHV